MTAHDIAFLNNLSPRRAVEAAHHADVAATFSGAGDDQAERDALAEAALAVLDQHYAYYTRD